MIERVVVLVMAVAGSALGLLCTQARAQSPNWSGAYVGAEIGGASDSESPAIPFFTPTLSPVYVGGPLDIYSNFPGTFHSGQTSPIGTVFAGYQLQYGSFIAGVESDISGLPAEGSHSFTSQNMIAAQLTASGGTQCLYTLRPRLGIAVDRALIFGTAGLALGGTQISTAYEFHEHFGPMTAFQNSYGATTAVRAGYVLGGGIEYALNDHLQVRAESDYFDLGIGEATATGTAHYHQGFPPVNRYSSAAPYHVSQRFDGVIARLGLGYRL